MATDGAFAQGHARARAKERTNYNDGKSGSGARAHLGPASKRGVAPGNPTKGGGITRRLKGATV